MKRILKPILLLFTLAVIISACSTTKNASTGAANVSRGKFVGTWTVTNVSYDGVLQNAVQRVLDQAPPADFVGSTWKLYNSGDGIYTLPNGVSQTIFWSVYNNDASGQMFQFKKIYQGDKAKNVTEGYRLLIGQNDGSSMTLRIPIALGSGNGYVTYTFNKQ
ncbi:hypothetical protein MUY27_16890 [Mucilaginibacter sp. RS28]|uniref:Lipocalin-like domain-containing protein n=1 Tax=Mucilaginibacter straminoryzae TaxID=2932774 RepID=A0A9X2BCV5_9SPHI|nr:hypothetical protein [Mucilaginibacter straminoryzae]MCJ8211397.1 hypothetical protein [Mucilaginibacter straminoryzae]